MKIFIKKVIKILWTKKIILNLHFIYLKNEFFIIKYLQIIIYNIFLYL